MPEHPPEQEDQEGTADDDQQREQGVVAEPAELDVEGRSRLEEQQAVDDGADDGEEDLVDDVSGEDPREAGAGDDRNEHQQRHERADVGRQEAVHPDTDGIGGHDRPQRHAGVRVGVAEDPVVGDPVERRLGHLQQHPGDQIADRNSFELIPEMGQPALDVDAQQVQDDQKRRDDQNPAAHLDQASIPRRVAERAHGSDCRAGGDRCAHEPAAPVRESQVLELSNALFSSPFASSPWRSVNVVLTSVPIVARVTVADETALITPLIPEAFLSDVSIVVTFCSRLVESWSSESFACCPAWVSGLPSPFRSEESVCVADFVSSTAVWSPLFVGIALQGAGG